MRTSVAGAPALGVGMARRGGNCAMRGIRSGAGLRRLPLTLLLLAALFCGGSGCAAAAA
jgi:hypothetical protein